MKMLLETGTPLRNQSWESPIRPFKIFEAPWAPQSTVKSSNITKFQAETDARFPASAWDLGGLALEAKCVEWDASYFGGADMRWFFLGKEPCFSKLIALIACFDLLYIFFMFFRCMDASPCQKLHLKISVGHFSCASLEAFNSWGAKPRMDNGQPMEAAILKKKTPSHSFTAKLKLL